MGKHRVYGDGESVAGRAGATGILTTKIFSGSDMNIGKSITTSFHSRNVRIAGDCRPAVVGRAGRGRYAQLRSSSGNVAHVRRGDNHSTQGPPRHDHCVGPSSIHHVRLATHVANDVRRQCHRTEADRDQRQYTVRGGAFRCGYLAAAVACARSIGASARRSRSAWPALSGAQWARERPTASPGSHRRR